MKRTHRIEVFAGFLLLFSPAKEAVAWHDLQSQQEVSDSEYLDGPNILEMMMEDNEQAVPPTRVSGSYLTGMVVNQKVQANWVQSEVGIQLYVEGEQLDPRRYQVDWKVVSNPNSVVRAKWVASHSFDLGQKIQIHAPLNTLNGSAIGSISIEVKITDRDQPEKAPEVIVMTLRELLANGRDGL